ncbi:MAG: mechanosensitive ion channel [Proteobacteria bacterium]|nr:mechanosensitive ion channel [Pseudomonadota bacterium]
MDQTTPTFIAKTKAYFEGLFDSPEVLLTILQALFFAVLIYWLGKKIARSIANISAAALEKTGNDAILVNFVRNLVYYVLFTAVIIMALAQLGIQTTSLLAILGAAGLAIGLALKDSLSNFASGIMLVIFRPFKLGDFIEAAGMTGKVIEIHVFSSIVHTSDNRKIIIPNGQITSGVIINLTALDTRRIDINLGISYNDDLKKAKQIMLETVMAHPLVLKDPEPGLSLTELANSSINFTIRSWTKTDDYWTVRSDLLEQLKIKLEAGGCSFPYPQTDVHLHKVN